MLSKTASPATPTAVHTTTLVLPLETPWSMITLKSNGVTTTVMASSTTVTRKAAMIRRYGRAKATMRRVVPGASRLFGPSRVNERYCLNWWADIDMRDGSRDRRTGHCFAEREITVSLFPDKSSVRYALSGLHRPGLDRPG